MAHRLEGEAMLLQCGIDAAHAAEDARHASSWLRPETLESLTELNELGLTLLLQQATLECALHAAQSPPLLRELGAFGAKLEPQALRRAAACPYLLLDAGFADGARWRLAPPGQVADAAAGGDAAAFFTVPATVEVARLVLTFGWHLARTQLAAARLLLGMPAACAGLIGGLTLRRIHALAERHPQWLRPRWPGRPQVWRELLSAANLGEPRTLERAQMHGLTLLAAEVRAAAEPHPRVSAPAAAPGQSARTTALPRLTSPAGTASTAPSPRSPARP
jgi:hypothetical protein